MIVDILSKRASLVDGSWVAFVDFIYCEYITSCALLGDQQRKLMIDKMCASIGDDLLFYDPDDEKSHGGYHLTAYALSAYKLLGLKVDQHYAEGLIQKIVTEGYGYPAKIVNRLQFWRGSHEVAGKAAIILSLLELSNLSDEAISKSNDFLESWFSYYNDRVGRDGLWRPIGGLIQIIFDAMYRIRHKPVYAKYGAAAHLYWIYYKRKVSLPNLVDAELAMDSILKLYQDGYVLEAVPYCLDFDVLCIANKVCDDFGMDRTRIDKLLFDVGCSIREFMVNSSDSMWNHAFPGALAALCECSRSEEFRIYANGLGETYRNPFQKVDWL